MSTVVELKIESGIASIRFTRPQSLNSINADMASAFLSAVRRVEADLAVRVVVISSQGRAFMAGGDIPAFKDGSEVIARTLITPMSEALQILSKLQAPVVASVQGAAAGAGMSLALACDIVLASEDARFTFAYGLLGASCDLGVSWNLPRQVGLHKAMQIALLSDPLDAQEAQRLGLVYRVVAPAALESETADLVRRLSQGPTKALGNLKRLLRKSSTQSYFGQLAAERDAFKECAETGDFQEGVLAFLDKRKPQFQGQ
jgi:2-(1,2-epoxy-1,2-dihydrophenyl)acetyl-CoA isomerase